MKMKLLLSKFVLAAVISLALMPFISKGQLNNPLFDSRFSMELETKQAQNEVTATIGSFRSGDVVVTTLMNEYTFPYGISPNGEYIVIAGFGSGGVSFYWTQATGLTPFPGTGYGISTSGLVGGSFENPDLLYNGNPVETAGTWNFNTNSWTFLGMNPAAPNVTIPDYNSGWGISDDGSTVVGLQYVNGYSLYQAFSWTSSGGYSMIGNQHPLGSRASGISRDGSLVFGWVQPPSTSRSPAVWKDGQLHYVAEEQSGEAFAASPSGSYAAGTVGTNAFIWSLAGGMEEVPNTLNPGAISPTIIMDDKTMFGYTNEAWPPFPDARRAYARYSDGTMVTFNDYAQARGMADAQEWVFFSVNAVTPDENKFIGAGITPQGQIISFLLVFPADAPSIQITPESLSETLDQNETSTQELLVSNTGTAMLNFSTAIEYTVGSGWLGLSPSWGQVGAGNQTTVLAAFDAAGLEAGTYTAQIVFNSNDPESPQIAIPVELTVNDVCEVPFNLEAEIDNDNPNLIHLAWEHPESNSRAFLGFNVYKGGELLEENWPSNTYFYTEMQINLHCFVVTAVYSLCGESEPSNEACADITVGIEDKFIGEVLIVSPNPANNVIHISGLTKNSIVQVYNQSGIKLLEMIYTNKTQALDISNFMAGYYILIATDEKGMVKSKRFLKR